MESPFYPTRVASWWNKAEDLLWPEKRSRDKIQRRADALAEAEVDTVVQFGFHLRFDFAWYFGNIHGMMAEVVEALHERDIRFLDHYSCNLLARPKTAAEKLQYHTHQRHHVDLYPDPIAAQTAGYDGHRFQELCEVDLVNWERAYTQSYQAELLCHNNPNFLAMHKSYLKRLFSEVPLDGIMTDDMVFYNYFRSCGCPYCRQRFKREFGRDLPPISDNTFWGDTSGHPTTWGNYDNPAFRDWVQMRYRTVADHLRMVKQTIGPDKALMTCCAASGSQALNSLALSCENFIDIYDWVMMENCGIGPGTVKWSVVEPEAMLHKSIAGTKNAPTVAISYTIYDDGAYLDWAIARFWGVSNWISSLSAGLPEDPGNCKEEAELTAPYNKWEIQHDNSAPGEDVVEARVAFLRANKENGWKDENGLEYWDRVSRWSKALLERNIGYRFVSTQDFKQSGRLLTETSPLILDGCAHVSDAELAYVTEFLQKGGKVWIAPPFATFTEKGEKRDSNVLDALKDEFDGRNLTILNTEQCPDAIDNLIADEKLSPRIKVTGQNKDWRLRLRQRESGVVLHLLNQALEGTEHPTVKARWGASNVLDTILSTAQDTPVEVELSLDGLKTEGITSPVLISPDLKEPRPVKVTNTPDGRVRLAIDLTGIRIYGMIRL